MLRDAKANGLVTEFFERWILWDALDKAQNADETLRRDLRMETRLFLDSQIREDHNALDLWTAFREGAFKPSERPWLGYFILLEDAPGSRSPVRTTSQHFKVFPEFQNASYAKRYELLCTRLVTERHYDAAWLMLSSRDKGPRGAYTEPSAELGFHVFAKSLAARAIAFATL